ncbi:hypothetical protein [Streptomyces melanogenes]|uniref:hypothetical protein n=1 Tax=Streptomyces melanogenes TaxID=67326 RepID=UPI00167D6EB0|nr:hypothetical protein [Streptomyces melanogenes]
MSESTDLAAIVAAVQRDMVVTGLAARSRGRLTHEAALARLERGGDPYRQFLSDGHAAAVQALEAARQHGIDAVDKQLVHRFAERGITVSVPDVAQALDLVRRQALVPQDDVVSEVAYWVPDSYWTQRYNEAVASGPRDKYAETIEQVCYRRSAMKEWSAPGGGLDEWIPGLHSGSGRLSAR